MADSCVTVVELLTGGLEGVVEVLTGSLAGVVEVLTGSLAAASGEEVV